MGLVSVGLSAQIEGHPATTQFSNLPQVSVESMKFNPAATSLNDQRIIKEDCDFKLRDARRKLSSLGVTKFLSSPNECTWHKVSAEEVAFKATLVWLHHQD